MGRTNAKTTNCVANVPQWSNRQPLLLSASSNINIYKMSIENQHVLSQVMGLMGLSQFIGSHQLDGQQLHRQSLAESLESARPVQKSDYLEIWEISESRHLDVM